MAKMKQVYLTTALVLLIGDISKSCSARLGESSGLPPKYLSVNGHRDCLSSHLSSPQDSFKSVCIPEKRPQACLIDSWTKLREIAENEMIDSCHIEENIEKATEFTVYTSSSKPGYCSIDATGRRHEHCRCSKGNEDLNDCKERCDEDSKCKGYSYRNIKSRCYLYTTSTCTNGCNKRSKGRLGDLIEKGDREESGCYVKEKDSGSSSKLEEKSGNSCEGRCGDGLDPNSSCRCNDACVEYNDCCDDYAFLCGSCYDRCDAGYDQTFPCQCNDNCEEYNNCCKDKNDICQGTITDEDLKAIAEELVKLDDNNAGAMVQTNPQGKTSTGSFEDHAPDPFFTSVDSQAWGLPTIEVLLTLLDNYDTDVRTPEDHTSAEQAEEDAFLSKVMETRVMKKAYEFCLDNGIFSGSVDDFKNYLKKIWFGLYDRDGNSGSDNLGSSGFEHVFIGEIKGGEVSGFHDWVHFYQQEKVNAINYLGYLNSGEHDFNGFGSGISDVFTWNGDIKKFGSMFVGTSPELVMALDTICFLARTDGVCPMSLNNVPIYITTYTMQQGGETFIGTAYPDWEKPY